MNLRDNKKFKRILNLDIILAMIPLFVLVFLTFFGVLMRYVAGKPLGWIEEIQLISIVWIIFIGAGFAFRTGNHVAIEIIYDIFPEKVRKKIDILIFAIGIFTIGYLFLTSIQYIQLFIKSARTTSILHIPYAYIYVIAPVSCVLQFVNLLLTTYFGVTDEYEEVKE